MKILTGPKTLFVHVMVLFVLISVDGCQRTVVGVGSPPPSPSPQAVKSGPPAHAPAHGYRAKHQYRYYPESEVYYDPGRNLYFYLNGGQWSAAVSLPSAIRLDTSFVSLELDTSRPYDYHAQNKAKHPGKDKHKKK